jgi:GNAT superfamily N-acetyltransferase
MTVRGQPHHWFLTPTSLPADLAERLLRAGGAKMGEIFGMAMELSQLAPAPALPIGVEIRPANEDSLVREYARLYIQLFETPTEAWEDNLVNAELEIFHSGYDHFHRYLAYENGCAIAAGMTCLEDGVASIETLSTLPECRNRGIGAVLATQALQNERENGAHIAVVWSSPGARRLYSRMGFRDVCTGNLFAFSSAD